MIRTVLSIIIILVLFSCSSPNSKDQKQSKTVKKENVVKKKIKKKKSFPRLTQKNIVDFLTKYGEENPENLVELETPFGKVKIRLYDGTPLHRANFIMLIKRGYFNQTLFNRVVLGHVIQGGNSDEQEVYNKRVQIGSYRLPAEIKDKYYHKKGALAMVRKYENNPQKLSSPFEFYIVQGEPLFPVQYDGMSEHKKAVYEKLGGTPHLDGEHTVFGEVVEGLQYIDSVAAVATDAREWPLKDIPVKLSVIE